MLHALPSFGSDLPHGLAVGEPRLNRLDQVAQFFSEHPKEKYDALLVDRFMPQSAEVHGIAKKALLDSAYSNNVGIVKLLLAARNTDLKSPEGKRLVVSAARSAGVTRFLLEKGADVNSRDPETGETPLMAAVGSLDSFKLLLARGADVNATDNSGRSALWAATVTETNTGFITLLGEHGANVNAQDSSGRTALMEVSDMCRD